MGAVVLNPGVKPAQWGFRPDLVSPEWRAVLEKAFIFLPLWDGFGDGNTATEWINLSDHRRLSTVLQSTANYPIISSSRFGRLAQFDALLSGSSSRGGYVDLADIYNSDFANQNYTLLVIFDRLSSQITNPIFFGYGSTTSSRDLIQIDRNGNDLRFLVRGSSNNLANATISSAASTSNQFYVSICQQNGDNIELNARKFPRGSWQRATGSASIGTVGTIDKATLTGRVAGLSTVTNQFDGHVPYFLALRGQWTEQLKALIDSDPFGLLRMRDEPPFFVAAVAGSTIPVFDHHYRSMRAA